jgi:hypothetical protein
MSQVVCELIPIVFTLRILICESPTLAERRVLLALIENLTHQMRAQFDLKVFHSFPYPFLVSHMACQFKKLVFCAACVIFIGIQGPSMIELMMNVCTNQLWYINEHHMVGARLKSQ